MKGASGVLPDSVRQPLVSIPGIAGRYGGSNEFRIGTGMYPP